MVITEAMQVRSLAAEFRSRAEFADPPIARILFEIAKDLDDEAKKLDKHD